MLKGHLHLCCISIAMVTSDALHRHDRTAISLFRVEKRAMHALCTVKEIHTPCVTTGDLASFEMSRLDEAASISIHNLNVGGEYPRERSGIPQETASNHARSIKKGMQRQYIYIPMTIEVVDGLPCMF